MIDGRPGSTESQQSYYSPGDSSYTSLDDRFAIDSPTDIPIQVSQSNCRCNASGELHAVPNGELEMAHTNNFLPISQPSATTREGCAQEKDDNVCIHWRYHEHGHKRRRTFSYPYTSRPFRFYPLPKSQHVKPVCARCATKRPQTHGLNFGDAKVTTTSHSHTLMSGVLGWVKKIFSRPASQTAQKVSFAEEHISELPQGLGGDNKSTEVQSSILPDVVNKQKLNGSLCSVVPDLSSQMELSIDLQTDYNELSQQSPSADAESATTFRTALQASELKLPETKTTYYTPREQVRSTPWSSDHTPTNYGLSPMNLHVGLTPSTNSAFSLTGTGTYHTPADANSSGGTPTCRRKAEGTSTTAFNVNRKRLPDDVPEKTVMGKTPPPSSAMTIGDDIPIEVESPVSRDSHIVVTYEQQLERQIPVDSPVHDTPIQVHLKLDRFWQPNSELGENITDGTSVKIGGIRESHTLMEALEDGQVSETQKLFETPLLRSQCDWSYESHERLPYSSNIDPIVNEKELKTPVHELIPMVNLPTNPKLIKSDLDGTIMECESTNSKINPTQLDEENKKCDLLVTDQRFPINDRGSALLNEHSEYVISHDSSANIMTFECLQTLDSPSMYRETPDLLNKTKEPQREGPSRPNDQDSLQPNPSDYQDRSADNQKSLMDQTTSYKEYHNEDGGKTRSIHDNRFSSPNVEQSLNLVSPSTETVIGGTVYQNISKIHGQRKLHISQMNFLGDSKLIVDNEVQLAEPEDKPIIRESMLGFKWRELKAVEVGRKGIQAQKRMSSPLTTAQSSGVSNLILHRKKDDEVEIEQDEREEFVDKLGDDNLWVNPNIELVETAEQNESLNQPYNSESEESVVPNEVLSEMEDASKSVSLTDIFHPEISNTDECKVEQTASPPEDTINHELFTLGQKHDLGSTTQSVIFKQTKSPIAGEQEKISCDSQVASQYHMVDRENINTDLDQYPFTDPEIVRALISLKMEPTSKLSTTEQSFKDTKTAAGLTATNTVKATNTEVINVFRDQELPPPIGRSKKPVNEEYDQANSVRPSPHEHIKFRLGLMDPIRNIPENFGQSSLKQFEVEPREGSRAEDSALEQANYEKKSIQEETMPPPCVMLEHGSTTRHTETNTTRPDETEKSKSSFISEMKKRSKSSGLEPAVGYASAVADHHFKVDEKTNDRHMQSKQKKRDEHHFITTPLRMASGRTLSVVQEENQTYTELSTSQPNLARGYTSGSDNMAEPEETSPLIHTISSPEVVTNAMRSEMEHPSESPAQDKLLQHNKLLFTATTGCGFARIAEPMVGSEKEKQIIRTNASEEQGGSVLNQVDQVTSPITQVLECNIPTQQPEYEEHMVLEQRLELGVMFDTDQIEMTAFWTTVPHPQPTTTETVDPEAAAQQSSEGAGIQLTKWDQFTDLHSTTFMRSSRLSTSEVFTEMAVTSASEDAQLRQQNQMCDVDTLAKDITFAEAKYDDHIKMKISGRELQQCATPIQNPNPESVLNAGPNTESFFEKSMIREETCKLYQSLEGTNLTAVENDQQEGTKLTGEQICYFEKMSAHSTDKKKQVNSAAEYGVVQNYVAPNASLNKTSLSTSSVLNWSGMNSIKVKPFESRPNAPNLNVTINSSIEPRSIPSTPENRTAIPKGEMAVPILPYTMNVDTIPKSPKNILNEEVSKNPDLLLELMITGQMKTQRGSNENEEAQNDEKSQHDLVKNVESLHTTKKELKTLAKPRIFNCVPQDLTGLAKLPSPDLGSSDLTSPETVVAYRIDGRAKLQISNTDSTGIMNENFEGKQCEMDETAFQQWPLDARVCSSMDGMQCKSAKEDSFLHSEHSVSLIPENGSLLSLRSQTENEDGSGGLSPFDGYDLNFIIEGANSGKQADETTGFVQPTHNKVYSRRDGSIDKIPTESDCHIDRFINPVNGASHLGVELRSKLSGSIRKVILLSEYLLETAETMEHNLTDAPVIMEPEAIHAADSWKPIAYFEMNTGRRAQTQLPSIRLANLPMVLTTPCEKPDPKLSQQSLSPSEVGSLERLELIPTHKLSLESTSTYFTAQSSLTGINRVGITTMESDMILPELDYKDDGQMPREDNRMSVTFPNTNSLTLQKYVTSEEHLPPVTQLPIHCCERDSNSYGDERDQSDSLVAPISSSTKIDKMSEADPIIETKPYDLHCNIVEPLAISKLDANGKQGAEHMMEIEMKLNIRYARSPETESDNLMEINAEMQPIEMAKIGSRTDIYLQSSKTSEHVENRLTHTTYNEQWRKPNTEVIPHQSLEMTEKRMETIDDSCNPEKLSRLIETGNIDPTDMLVNVKWEEIGAPRWKKLGSKTNQTNRAPTDCTCNPAEFKLLSDMDGSISKNQLVRAQAIGRTHADIAASLAYYSDTTSTESFSADLSIEKLHHTRRELLGVRRENFDRNLTRAQSKAIARSQSTNNGKIVPEMPLRLSNTSGLMRSKSTDERIRNYNWLSEVTSNSPSRGGSSMSLPHFTENDEHKGAHNVDARYAYMEGSPTSCAMNFCNGHSSAGRPSSPLEWSLASTVFMPYSNTTTISDSALPTSPTGHKLAQRSDTVNWIRPYAKRARPLAELPANHNVGRISPQHESSNSNLPTPSGRTENEGSPNQSGARSPNRSEAQSRNSRVSQVQITISQRLRRSKPRSREDGYVRETDVINSDRMLGSVASPAPSDLQKTAGEGSMRATSPTEISSNIELDLDQHTVAREITDQAIYRAMTKLCSNSPTMLSSANSEVERESEQNDEQPVTMSRVINVTTRSSVHVSPNLDIRDHTSSPVTIAPGTALENSVQVSPTATAAISGSPEPRAILSRPNSPGTYSIKADLHLVTSRPPSGSSQMSAEISTHQEVNIPGFSEISSTWMSNIDVISGGEDQQCQVTTTFDLHVTARNVQTPSDLGALLSLGQSSSKFELTQKMNELIELAAQDLPVDLSQSYVPENPPNQSLAVYEDAVRTVEDPQCQLSASFNVCTITRTSLVVSSPAVPREEGSQTPTPLPLPATLDDRQQRTISFRTEIQVISETDPEQTIDPEAEAKPAQTTGQHIGKTNAGDLSKAASPSLKKDFHLSIDRSGGVESPTSMATSNPPEGEPPVEQSAFSRLDSPQEETKGVQLTSDEFSTAIQNPDEPSAIIHESEAIANQMDHVPNVVTEEGNVKTPEVDDLIIPEGIPDNGAEEGPFSSSPEPTVDLPDIVSPISGETFSTEKVEDKIQSAPFMVEEQELNEGQRDSLGGIVKSNTIQEHEPVNTIITENPAEEVSPSAPHIDQASDVKVLHVLSHMAISTETRVLENEKTGELEEVIVPHLEITTETYLEAADGMRIPMEESPELVRIFSNIVNADEEEKQVVYRHNIVTGPIGIDGQDVKIQQVIDAVMLTPEKPDVIQKVEGNPIADADTQAVQSGLTVNVSDHEGGEHQKTSGVETIDDTQTDTAVSTTNPTNIGQVETSQLTTDIGEQKTTEAKQCPIEDMKVAVDTEQIEERQVSPRPTTEATKSEIEQNVTEQEIIAVPEPTEAVVAPEPESAADCTSNEPDLEVTSPVAITETKVNIGEQKFSEMPEVQRSRTISIESENSVRISGKQKLSEEQVPVSVDETSANIGEQEKNQSPEVVEGRGLQDFSEPEKASSLTAPDSRINVTLEQTLIVKIGEQAHATSPEIEEDLPVDFSKSLLQVEGKTITPEPDNELQANKLVGAVGQQEHNQEQEYAEDMILSLNEDITKKLASTEQVPDTLAGAETIPLTETPGEGGLHATSTEEKEETTVATKMDVDGTFEQPIQEYQDDAQKSKISGPAQLEVDAAKTTEEIFVQSPTKQTLSETALFEDTMAPGDVDPITMDQPQEQIVEQSQIETQLSSIEKTDYHEQTGESKLASEAVEEKSITEMTDIEKTKAMDQLSTRTGELKLPETKEEPTEDKPEEATELQQKSIDIPDMAVIAKQTEQPMEQPVQMIQPLEIQEPPVSMQHAEGKSNITEVTTEITISINPGEPPEISVKTITGGVSEQTGRKYDIVIAEKPVQQQMLPSTDDQMEMNEETSAVVEAMTPSVKIDEKQGRGENLRASLKLHTLEMEQMNQEHGLEGRTIGMTVDADQEGVPIDNKLSPSLVAEGTVKPNKQNMIAGLREMDVYDPRSTEADEQVAQSETQKLIERAHTTASTPGLEVEQLDQRVEESLTAEGLDEQNQICLQQATVELEQDRISEVLERKITSIEDMALLTENERVNLVQMAEELLARVGDNLTDEQLVQIKTILALKEELDHMMGPDRSLTIKPSQSHIAVEVVSEIPASNRFQPADEEPERLETTIKPIEGLITPSDENSISTKVRKEQAGYNEELREDEKEELEVPIDTEEGTKGMVKDEDERRLVEQTKRGTSGLSEVTIELQYQSHTEAGVQPIEQIISPTETTELKLISDAEQCYEQSAKTDTQDVIDNEKTRLAIIEKFIAMSDSEREVFEQEIITRLANNQTLLPLSELQMLNTTLKLTKEIYAMTPDEREAFLARTRAKMAKLLSQTGEMGLESVGKLDASIRSEVPVSSEVLEPSMSPLESKRTFDLAPSPASVNEDLVDAWKSQPATPGPSLDKLDRKSQEDMRPRFSKNAESTYHDSMLTIKADVKPVGEVPTTLGTSRENSEPTIAPSVHRVGSGRRARGIRTQEDSDSLDRHFKAMIRATRKPTGVSVDRMKYAARRCAGQTMRNIRRAEKVVNALDALILETIQYIKQNVPLSK